jgi:sirohydrochlorin ferrochelatase
MVFLLFGLDLAVATTTTRQVTVASTDSSQAQGGTTYYVISTSGEHYEVDQDVYETAQTGERLTSEATTYPAVLDTSTQRMRCSRGENALRKGQ